MDSSPELRRFTLADAMILVAATALGFVPIRLVWLEVSHWTVAPNRLAPLANIVQALVVAILLAAPGVATWTTALLPLRFLRPRPELSRLILQPGFFSALMGAVVGVVGLFEVVQIWVGPDAPDATLRRISDLSLMLGAGIAAPWLILILLGEWRPAEDWVDRLGRTLGWFWFLAALLSVFLRGLIVVPSLGSSLTAP